MSKRRFNRLTARYIKHIKSLLSDYDKEQLNNEESETYNIYFPTKNNTVELYQYDRGNSWRIEIYPEDSEVK